MPAGISPVPLRLNVLGTVPGAVIAMPAPGLVDWVDVPVACVAAGDAPPLGRPEALVVPEGLADWLFAAGRGVSLVTRRTARTPTTTMATIMAMVLRIANISQSPGPIPARGLNW
jgi:hypothetical protein